LTTTTRVVVVFVYSSAVFAFSSLVFALIVVVVATEQGWWLNQV
jgi:hypothetical protein